jgi:RNA polymerase sigma factor (sigma-70 family)
MSAGGSVSEWIQQLKTGEETALEKIHQRYWPILVGLARRKLKGLPGRAADEEDVVQDAFWSFYRSFRAGRVPRLNNRNDLLALLTHIIACKAVNQIKRELNQKRGGGQIGAGALLDVLAEKNVDSGLAGTSRHGPLEQALVNDFYQYYVSQLPENLRDFAELYLAGCTHKETAERMGCSLRSVERKIALILERWRQIAVEQVQENLEG